MILRPYQRAAIDSLYAYFGQKDGNPLLVLPTGSGKSVIQAQFQKEVLARWPDQRILLLTHVRELIEQNVDKLVAVWPEAPIGIYAASLNRREHFLPIVFASIQSVHKRARLLGRFDLIIIDECHLVPMSQNTMYRRFLADMRAINPAVKIIGMSATPFRLDSGWLHKGVDAIFTDIAFDLPITQLIDQNFLVPLITKGAERKIDLRGVKTRAGEFVSGDVDEAVHTGDLTERAADEIVRYGELRQSWLIFCPSVAYAEEFRDTLRARGIVAHMLSGETPKAERARLVAEFRSGRIRALTNCDVLTTGFDAPAVDLIAFLRPTKSASLYIQMSGRGMRLSPETGKTNCLVLDFAGNVERHGPVDAVHVRDKSPGAGREPQVSAKECPDCRTIVSVFVRVCPECGYLWSLGSDRPKHSATASERAILSTQVEPEWFDVVNVRYERHQKPGRPDSVRVNYYCGLRRFSEWVCVEHEGYARSKAALWLYRHGAPMFSSVSETLERHAEIQRPRRILVRLNGKFEEVIDHDFGTAPAATHAALDRVG